MLVMEVEDYLSRRAESQIEIPFGTLEIAEDASVVSVGSDRFALDEVAEKALSDFMHIPYAYLKKCNPEFKAKTLTYWRDVYEEADAVISHIDGELVGVHSPDLQALPSPAIGRMIGNVFDPFDEAKIQRGHDYLHIDIITRKEIEVPNPAGLPFRPEVGDITRAGARILTYPHTVKPPSALAYMERLACTNGMCVDEKVGRINIKGNTVPEIIDELETAARRVLGGLDAALESYAATANLPVPGSLQAFAHQLAREYKLTRGVLDEVMLIINQLPETATVYDVVQAFTSVANRDVPYATARTLQTVGGMLALDTERQIARCNSCERILPHH